MPDRVSAQVPTHVGPKFPEPAVRVARIGVRPASPIRTAPRDQRVPLLRVRQDLGSVGARRKVQRVDQAGWDFVIVWCELELTRLKSDDVAPSRQIFHGGPPSFVATRQVQLLRVRAGGSMVHPPYGGGGGACRTHLLSLGFIDLYGPCF